MHVMVALPLIRKRGLDLYQKTSHPLELPGHKLPLIVKGDNYLAVDEKRTWFFTVDKLKTGCKTISGELFCEGRVLRSDWREECTSALYKGLWDAALEQCHVSDFKEAFSTQRLNATAVSVATQKPLHYDVVCSYHYITSGSFPPNDKTTVNVPTGCELITPSFHWRPSSKKVKAIHQAVLLKATFSNDTINKLLAKTFDFRERELMEDMELASMVLLPVNSLHIQTWYLVGLVIGGNIILAGVVYVVISFQNKVTR
jgi:hypothetical protein